MAHSRRIILLDDSLYSTVKSQLTSIVVKAQNDDELKKELYKINLGQSDAESEIDTLYKYFFPTKAYLTAKGEANSRKVFYIGHRGAGKSALFNQLVHEYSLQRDTIVIQITPTNYEYERFKSMQHDFADVKAAYSIAWQYTLFIQIFTSAVDYYDKNPNIKRNRDNYKIIKDYLQNNNLAKEDFGINILIKYLKKIHISKINLKSVELEFLRDEKEVSKVVTFKEILTPLNALRNILDSVRIHMLIDELDTGWDNTTEAKNFIHGLFTSVIAVNKLHNMNVYVSIRQDMYDNLQKYLPNTEKMRDSMEFLYWDERGLKNLIARRINSNLPKKFDNMTMEESLAIVFEEGDSKTESVIDYIINHTMHRPREVIYFCNKCLGEYVQRYNKAFQWLYAPGLDYQGTKINLDIAKAVARQFSVHRFIDFCKEFNDEYPEIEFMLKRFEDTREYFTRAEIIKLLDNAVLEYLQAFGENNWVGDLNLNSNKLLEILYRIGFIKVYINSATTYTAYYQDAVLNLDRIEKFKVGDVFCPAMKFGT
jgi:hypothetical protein